MNIDKLIFKMLLLDQNETQELSSDDYEYFRILIVELTKIKYNIRYCTNNNCPCHPESTLKKLLGKDNLAQFLKENNLLKEIEYLTINYVPIVAEGIFN